MSETPPPETTPTPVESLADLVDLADELTAAGGDFQFHLGTYSNYLDGDVSQLDRELSKVDEIVVRARTCLQILKGEPDGEPEPVDTDA